MRKVLIITYYWPPAGGPGVQRWLYFTKYLKEFDIEPVIYCPENPSYPITDDKLSAEIPEELSIHKGKIWEPHSLAAWFSKGKSNPISAGIIPEKNPGITERLLLWIRGNFFIPDARKYWIKPSFKRLKVLLEQHQIHTVITTGPPHSLHLIGYKLKQWNPSLLWLADFRDPWTSIGYHNKLRMNPRSLQKHKKLERQVLQAADRLITTSQTTRSEFQQITAKPIRVITNGYDIKPDKAPQPKGPFSVAHIGSLLSGRNPHGLWEVLQELCAEQEGFENALEIRLIGRVSESVFKSIEKTGLKSKLRHIPYLAHEEALEQMRASQVLLLPEIPSKDTRGIIPGKLFEYLAVGRPILALGPDSWEAGEMIREADAGTYTLTSDKEAIKSALLRYFGRYQKNILVSDTRNIEQFHRRELTAKLADFIKWE